MTPIIVQEIEPGVAVRWVAQPTITRTCRVETVTVSRVGQPPTAVDRPCEPYEATEKLPDRAGQSFWANHTDEELADRKLYRAVPFAVPEGKHIVGEELFEKGADGVWHQVFEVEDDPPPPPPPTLDEKLAAAGLTPEDVAQAVAKAGTKLS